MIMKKIAYLFVILSAVLVCACHHSWTNSPVAQYVALLDAAAEKAENISSLNELVNVQDIINPQEAKQIIIDNRDYPLSDDDKKALKKSFDKLIRIAYEKTAEYGDLSDSMKKDTKKQIEMIVDFSNKRIDAANTLGDLLSL